MDLTSLISIAAPLWAADARQNWLDIRTNVLLGVVISLLAAAYFIGRALRRAPESTASPAVVRTFNLRVAAWWMMCAILIAGFFLGYHATVVLFGLISFWALREFITMTPTRRGDHRTLFWTFFVFTPLQYFFVAQGIKWYGLYTIMIPVYASLFIPARIAIAGDPKRFLERVAKIQAGLLICVYSLSHAPALLDLDLTNSRGDKWTVGKIQQTTAESNDTTVDDGNTDIRPPITPPIPKTPTGEENSAEKSSTKNIATAGSKSNSKNTAASDDDASPETADTPADNLLGGSNAGLLFYFVLLVQLNDVFQFAWGNLLGRHVIAPSINASRTWEGLIGGALSTMLVGAVLWWATPFQIWEAACMSLAVALMGFAGGMTMSAIKRDRGVKDYGTLVSGHAGVLDRIDSLCFAAPIFFHLTRYFFTDFQ